VAKEAAAGETARQEIELKLNGKTFTCRPDFTTISNIEGVTEQSARALGMHALAAGMPLAQRGGLPEISMTQMAIILFWMVKGQKGAPESPAAIGELLMEDGYGQYLMPVGLFLTRAQRGNKEHEKEAAQAAAQAGPQTDEQT